MKIVTLIENTVGKEGLVSEHGLSLYIEACGKKLLFDTGETGAFADNADKLGVDLSQVDTAILSHAHSDHSGGFYRFFARNDTAPVYLRPEARGSYHNAAGNCISIDPILRHSKRLCFAGDEEPIGDGLTLCSAQNMHRLVPLDSAGLTKCREDLTLVPDDFLHEHYLLIQEQGKRVLISGCSHKGIINIVNHFRPQVLIGGFHYMRTDPRDPRLTQAAQTLLCYDCVYYTGHCTGLEQFQVLKGLMGNRLHYLSTGTILEI